MDIKEIASVLTWYEFERFVAPPEGFGMLVKDEDGNIYSAGQYRYECDSEVGHHQILGQHEDPDQPILKVFAYAYISDLIDKFASEIVELNEEIQCQKDSLDDLKDKNSKLLVRNDSLEEKIGSLEEQLRDLES